MAGPGAAELVQFSKQGLPVLTCADVHQRLADFLGAPSGSHTGRPPPPRQVLWFLIVFRPPPPSRPRGAFEDPGSGGG